MGIARGSKSLFVPHHVSVGSARRGTGAPPPPPPRPASRRAAHWNAWRERRRRRRASGEWRRAPGAARLLLLTRRLGGCVSLSVQQLYVAEGPGPAAPIGHFMRLLQSPVMHFSGCCCHGFQSQPPPPPQSRGTPAPAAPRASRVCADHGPPLQPRGRRGGCGPTHAAICRLPCRGPGRRSHPHSRPSTSSRRKHSLMSVACNRAGALARPLVLSRPRRGGPSLFTHTHHTHTFRRQSALSTADPAPHAPAP
jgi:hypothetical protein